jgi:hypothetical protein
VLTELKHRGWHVNHKRVKRIMREDNLLCIRKRKFVVATTDSNHARRVYPNIAADLLLTGVNQLWVSDITYIRLENEFVYLAVILDAYSRRVIGWSLEFGGPGLLSANPPLAGKCSRTEFPQIALPAVQDIRIDLTGAGNLGDRSTQLQPPHRGLFEFFGELPSRRAHDSLFSI